MPKFHRDFAEGSVLVVGGAKITIVARKGRKVRLTIDSVEPVQFFESAQKCLHANDGDQHGTHSDRDQ